MIYQNFGTYTSGDTGTDSEIEVVDRNGAAFDLTGATAITLEAASAEREAVSVAGAISGAATLGIVLLEDLAQAFIPTAARPSVAFRGVLKWTQAAESFRSRDGVRFVIARLP